MFSSEAGPMRPREWLGCPGSGASVCSALLAAPGEDAELSCMTGGRGPACQPPRASSPRHPARTRLAARRVTRPFVVPRWPGKTGCVVRGTAHAAPGWATAATSSCVKSTNFGATGRGSGLALPDQRSASKITTPMSVRKTVSAMQPRAMPVPVPTVDSSAGDVTAEPGASVSSWWLAGSFKRLLRGIRRAARPVAPKAYPIRRGSCRGATACRRDGSADALPSRD